jgi:hypothetical protein
MINSKREERVEASLTGAYIELRERLDSSCMNIGAMQEERRKETVRISATVHLREDGSWYSK